MNNKDLISFMEKLGGSNEIKINGLANMLVDTVDDSESSSTAYTSSILDLFASSDSESSYDSEGGKGKTKSPKKKSSKKKSKSKKPKKDKKKKTDSDSDSLLEHIESDTPVANTTVVIKPQPVQTGIPSLASLASSLFGTNTQPTQYVSNPQPVPQLINLANPTNSVSGFAQPGQSGLVTLQVTPQQAQVLAPIIAQMSANPNFRLSGGNIDIDLERVDNEIAELSKLLGL